MERGAHGGVGGTQAQIVAAVSLTPPDVVNAARPSDDELRREGDGCHNAQDALGRDNARKGPQSRGPAEAPSAAGPDGREDTSRADVDPAQDATASAAVSSSPPASCGAVDSDCLLSSGPCRWAREGPGATWQSPAKRQDRSDLCPPEGTGATLGVAVEDANRSYLESVAREKQGEFQHCLDQASAAGHTGPTSLAVAGIRQRHAWDCGLACVLMAARTLPLSRTALPSNNPALELSSDGTGSLHEQLCRSTDLSALTALYSLCNTNSVWTVDLAVLLRRIGYHVTFLTLTLGANPSFSNVSYYAKQLDEDGVRVSRLFRHAPCTGVHLLKRSLPSRQLAALLRQGQGRLLSIVLVDKRRLNHPQSNKDSACMCCGTTAGYIGHYVLVCGCDEAQAVFEIKDPSHPLVQTQSLWVSSATLDHARGAFGTDEDVLLVTTDPLVP